MEGPGSLFKKRPRREEFPRSFALKRGLQSVCDAAAAVPGVTVETGVAVTRVARTAAHTPAATTSSMATMMAHRFGVTVILR